MREISLMTTTARIAFLAAISVRHLLRSTIAGKSKKQTIEYKGLISSFCSFGVTLSKPYAESVNETYLTDKVYKNLANYYPRERWIDFSVPGACEAYQTALGTMLHAKQLAVGDFAQYLYSYLGTIIYDLESVKFADPLLRVHPNNYTTTFLQCAAQLADNSISFISEYAFKSQHLPIWTSPRLQLKNMQFKQNDIASVKALVPTVLALSIGGYSWLVPFSPSIDLFDTFDPEMFVRQVQAITFMSVMSFDFYALDTYYVYNQNNILALTRKYLALHAEHADLLIELAKRRIRDGSPIIRPMWYQEPDNPATYEIDDQFMVGEDLVVAPVVEYGQRERDVYLPSGIWVDQHGNDYEGPGEFKVAAPLEELPYFKRKVSPYIINNIGDQ